MAEETPLFTKTCALRQVDADVGHVVVVEGPDAGSTFPFASDVLSIGSGEQAGFRLSDRAVSRLHCELAHERGALRLRDLGSKNGTWIGGCRVDEALLGPGANVRIGSTTLQTRVDRERVQRPVWEGADQFGELLGGSAAMHKLFAAMARVAERDTRVLIVGESGTGKELVARALHDASPRRERPFVVVDAGALSHSLADVELFGHARGAFTGAHVDRAGAFERADGGTLFLDEVGELPLLLQPKLLRAVERGMVQRVGEGNHREVDVRVVAATHRPLARMVNEGTFREDLYYRLAVVTLLVPPLRERGPDVAVLARAFLSEIAPGDAEAGPRLTEALQSLAGYRWPGNVRELRSLVRRLAVLGDLGADVLPSTHGDGASAIRVDLPFGEAKQIWIEAFERQYLSRLLDETGGNVTEASRRASLARSRMHELVVRYRLK